MWRLPDRGMYCLGVMELPLYVTFSILEGSFSMLLRARLTHVLAGILGEMDWVNRNREKLEVEL